MVEQVLERLRAERGRVLLDGFEPGLGEWSRWSQSRDRRPNADGDHDLALVDRPATAEDQADIAVSAAEIVTLMTTALRRDPDKAAVIVDALLVDHPKLAVVIVATALRLCAAQRKDILAMARRHKPFSRHPFILGILVAVVAQILMDADPASAEAFADISTPRELLAAIRRHYRSDPRGGDGDSGSGGAGRVTGAGPFVTASFIATVIAASDAWGKPGRLRPIDDETNRLVDAPSIDGSHETASTGPVVMLDTSEMRRRNLSAEDGGDGGGDLTLDQAIDSVLAAIQQAAGPPPGDRDAAESGMGARTSAMVADDGGADASDAPAAEAGGEGTDGVASTPVDEFADLVAAWDLVLPPFAPGLALDATTDDLIATGAVDRWLDDLLGSADGTDAPVDVRPSIQAAIPPTDPGRQALDDARDLLLPSIEIGASSADIVEPPDVPTVPGTTIDLGLPGVGGVVDLRPETTASVGEAVVAEIQTGLHVLGGDGLVDVGTAASVSLADVVEADVGTGLTLLDEEGLADLQATASVGLGEIAVAGIVADLNLLGDDGIVDLEAAVAVSLGEVVDADIATSLTILGEEGPVDLQATASVGLGEIAAADVVADLPMLGDHGVDLEARASISLGEIVAADLSADLNIHSDGSLGVLETTLAVDVGGTVEAVIANELAVLGADGQVDLETQASVAIGEIVDVGVVLDFDLLGGDRPPDQEIPVDVTAAPTLDLPVLAEIDAPVDVALRSDDTPVAVAAGRMVAVPDVVEVAAPVAIVLLSNDATLDVAGAPTIDVPGLVEIAAPVEIALSSNPAPLEVAAPTTAGPDVAEIAAPVAIALLDDEQLIQTDATIAAADLVEAQIAVDLVGGDGPIAVEATIDGLGIDLTAGLSLDSGDPAPPAVPPAEVAADPAPVDDQIDLGLLDLVPTLVQDVVQQAVVVDEPPPPPSPPASPPPPVASVGDLLGGIGLGLFG